MEGAKQIARKTYGQSLDNVKSERIVSILLGSAAGLSVGLMLAGLMLDAPAMKALAFAFSALAAAFYFFAQVKPAKTISPRRAIYFQVIGSVFLILLLSLAISNFFQINTPAG